MAAPDAVPFLLVLAAVVPTLLVAGCNWCPYGYQHCGGQCWKRIEQVVPFWTAAPLCEAESTRLSGGDTKYIAIPSPRSKTENDCVIRFAREAAVWLGYIEIDKYNKVFQDYKHQWYMYYYDYENYYHAWAWDQPSKSWWASNEYHVVLVPDGWYVHPGWHDWHADALFHPLCATRYCR